tara:strand:+ start:921 stop:2054 length:1134 start_codon:yes stop_codon:yes gene_type:complete
MAHYQIYAEQDLTLYEKYNERNTGIDQILELTKTYSGSKLDGEYQANTYNSRILINFGGTQFTALSESIVDGTIGSTSRKFYLNLKNIYASSLPISYSLHAYPVSESWDNGTGNYDDTPEATKGASWKYRFSKQNTIEWAAGTQIQQGGGTGTTNVGGGTWLTGSLSEASHSFNNDPTDVRIDITDIANKWLDTSIPNYGLIVKQSDTDERAGGTSMNLKFFSKETHTVYAPRLEVVWSDYVNVGSTTAVHQTDNGGPIVYFKNIEENYPEGSRVQFRLGARSKYPTKTYSTSSFYATDERLAKTSSYAVCDGVTGETLLDYDDVYTKISDDAEGSYFSYWMNSLSPERYYKFKIRSKYSDSEIKYFDNGYYFKVVR